VLKIVEKVQRWWNGTPRARPAAHFEIACSCGQVLRGMRRDHYQVQPCAACAQPVFILGSSPLPASREAVLNTATEGNGSVRRWSLWWLPVFAGLLTLSAVVLLFWTILSDRGRDGSGVPTGPNTRAALMEAGEKALAQGEFQLGLEHLEAADAARNAKQGIFMPVDGRRLTQLLRQARLLANLLSEPLQDILVRAPGVPEREWQVQFARLYQGKAVLFDAEVRVEADRFSLDYSLEAEGKPARLDLANLKVLADLKEHGFLTPDKPRRLFFGGRLASVAREAGGEWVIRFERGSGALLTDLGIAATVSPLPLDAEQRDVIEAQAEWIAQLP